MSCQHFLSFSSNYSVAIWGCKEVDFVVLKIPQNRYLLVKMCLCALNVCSSEVLRICASKDL